MAGAWPDSTQCIELDPDDFHPSRLTRWPQAHRYLRPRGDNRNQRGTAVLALCCRCLGTVGESDPLFGAVGK